MSLDDAGQIHVIDSQKENLRLAEVIEDGFIPHSFFTKASDALLAMKGIGQSYHAEFRLIATQAIRAAENKLEFIEHIQQSTGFKLEIIDGVEEARLSYFGVIQSLSFGQDSVLSVDVGGASTEIAVGRGTDCQYLSSLKMGALLLSKRFLFDNKVSTESLEELRQSIESRISPIEEDLSTFTIEQAAATSGTAKALARMIHWDRTKTDLEDPHGFRFTSQELLAIEGELLQIIDSNRIALRWGLDIRRADIILAGVLILSCLTRSLKISQWSVSTSGLREGVAIDTYTRKGLLPMSRWQDLRWHSVQGFARKLRLDTPFAQAMSDLALRIFDAFVVYPEFNRMLHENLLDRELLKDAAFLLESGKFISFSSYHKHSYYLIAESNLLGFTQEEKHIIALTNRFARKSQAKPNKVEALPYLDGNITRINFLSSCLRIARCLLRTRQPKIKGFKVSGKNNSYIMHILFQPRVRIEAEKLAIKKELRNLEKALDCTLESNMTQEEE